MASYIQIKASFKNQNYIHLKKHDKLNLPIFFKHGASIALTIALTHLSIKTSQFGFMLSNHNPIKTKFSKLSPIMSGSSTILAITGHKLKPLDATTGAPSVINKQKLI